MSIISRRELEREALKEKILKAAKEILLKEGYEALSIRKIAEKIEYSPGIIYHYFKDKSEIVALVVSEGYEEILKTISIIKIDPENPEDAIIKNLKAYINLMLRNREQFKALLFTDDETLQYKVGILEEGVTKKRKSMKMLCDAVKLGIDKKVFKDLDPECTAQIIWTSTYGLISRLILEKNISEDQKERLIDHHFNILMNGIKK